ncbi:hypothetical protein F1737_02950 [Methanoplanus sp. FWC-SCC4]|uniref:KaiC-like domain-containing protein n=1 Tax=Methanochimaera problematica TaxID=2609417 RepID=A0AA97I200_9EURY|nr:hypothetical protein [Methanoplanus sp. FWC-SCC4]WOF15720.1 hypothetical protein F1737_02950 [Methanoplanus sp. FWC-SCC4]
MVAEIEVITSIGDHKRSTGVVGLDFQLGGGIPKGKTVIIYGDALSGCDRFAHQFWLADKSGESTYFMIDGKCEEGMIPAGDLSIEEIQSGMKGNWVVVDSLSSIIEKYGIKEAVSILTKGSEAILNSGGNIMMTLYRGIHSPQDETKIMRSADIFISLTDLMHGSEIERTLAINKIPGEDVPRRAYPYNIMADGIELSTTARVV